jgi:hypothetical protein
MKMREICHERSSAPFEPRVVMVKAVLQDVTNAQKKKRQGGSSVRQRKQDYNGAHHWTLGLMFPRCAPEEGKGCFALDKMCELINLLIKHSPKAKKTDSLIQKTSWSAVLKQCSNCVDNQTSKSGRGGASCRRQHETSLSMAGSYA